MALARRDSYWGAQLELLMFPVEARRIRAGRMPENGRTPAPCAGISAP